MIAAGLMLVALVSAVFGWMNWNRAKAADQQAQKARADAEKLVGFLIEDFYAELEPLLAGSRPWASSRTWR